MDLIQSQIIKSNFAKIDFDPKIQQNRLISLKDIKQGTVICHFSYTEVLPQPNRYTVQTGEDKHIILSPLYLEYVNHSCEPNCFFDTSNFKFIALKDIPRGEEFTFFYPSTEWDMDEVFECQCQTGSCLGDIRGAKYLGQEEIQRYRFSDYIQTKLKKVNKHVFDL
ncbi:MAG TPA: SET domain-containing methyltransferase [Saprospiraceae bacterium]|nr:SET domain-containing methyltransferase [Saprospiraceae bacterium]